MISIKLLTDHIENELDDACTYAELALEYRDTDHEMADLFHNLSGEEMTHMDALHKNVVRLIGKYRAEHGEPPAAMAAVYDYLHKRQIERAEKVNTFLSMYKR